MAVGLRALAGRLQAGGAPGGRRRTAAPLPHCPRPLCSPQFPEIIKAGPAARRVFELIDRQPAIDMARVGGGRRHAVVAGASTDWTQLAHLSPSCEQPGAEVELSGDVELRNVTFAYPARPGRLIFKYFNLQVPAGTSCALVRPLVPIAG